MATLVDYIELMRPLVEKHAKIISGRVLMQHALDEFISAVQEYEFNQDYVDQLLDEDLAIGIVKLMGFSRDFEELVLTLNTAAKVDEDKYED